MPKNTVSKAFFHCSQLCSLLYRLFQILLIDLNSSRLKAIGVSRDLSPPFRNKVPFLLHWTFDTSQVEVVHLNLSNFRRFFLGIFFVSEFQV